MIKNLQMIWRIKDLKSKIPWRWCKNNCLIQTSLFIKENMKLKRIMIFEKEEKMWRWKKIKMKNKRFTTALNQKLNKNCFWFNLKILVKHNQSKVWFSHQIKIKFKNNNYKRINNKKMKILNLNMRRKFQRLLPHFHKVYWNLFHKFLLLR